MPLRATVTRVAFSVGGVIEIVLGLFFVGRGLPGLLQSLRALGWRRTDGQILGAGTPGYTARAGGGHGRTRMVRGAVLYRYTHEGREYVGDRLSFGTPIGLNPALASLAGAARYEAGQAVTVFVDPKDPSRAVLRRSAPSSLVFALMGAGLLALGARSL
ncbi:MAG: DUF3592 domain-containing protein [Vicinamibacteria bacterium]